MQKTRIATLTVLLITGLLTTAIPLLVPTFAASDSWTLVNDARAMKAYPDLKEYVWQKNATMPPNGPYDKIGLHRLVKMGITPKGVVFMLPGAYGSGEQLVSNPPTDSYTKTENISNCIYWANRGLDVYALDYRRHFIPANFNSSQLSFMADWGQDQFISDMKEAIDKAKEVSGSSKLFLAGQSLGGAFALYYASKYWQQDLNGLILLDPALNSTPVKPNVQTNSYNLTADANKIKTYGNWSWENPQASSTPSPFNPGYLSLVQFAVQNPGAPAQYLNGTLITTINPRTNKTWTNITEWFEYGGRAMWNTYGGYSDITINMNFLAQGERYLPTRIGLDTAAFNDWTISPYHSYDYLAHMKEVNVPVLAFRSALLGIPAYGNVINRMATTDFTSIILTNYSHADVFQGTYSARDVSQPALDWMRSELVGLKATAFCDVTVMPGWTWNFFVHSNGGLGSHTYQWYEGTTPLQGQTSLILTVTKNTLGKYTYYCKVTDSEGATTNSNTVTLTVIS